MEEKSDIQSAKRPDEHKGTFYGISTGPGNDGYLTLDALELVKKCQVLAVPRTRSGHTVALETVKRANEHLCEMFGEAGKNYLGLAQKEYLYLDFLMIHEKEERKAAYQSFCIQIKGYLEQGKDVGMIVLGDVSVYATTAYLAEPLRQAGYSVVLSAGVTSFCAAAAAAGQSLTSMDKPLRILPASCEHLKEELLSEGSKVIMKSGRGLLEIKKILKENDLEKRAVLVRDCGMQTEEICTCLSEDSGCESYFTTILVQEEVQERGKIHGQKE